MAELASLIEDAGLIGTVLREFAGIKGWDPASFMVFMRINTQWNTYSVGIISPHFTLDRFDQVDDKYYIDILEFLRTRLGGELGLSQSISLHLNRHDDEVGVPTLYYPKPDEDEVEVDFGLLNPGVPDPRPKEFESLRRFRQGRS